MRGILKGWWLMALFLAVGEADAGKRSPRVAGESGRSVVIAPHGMVATSHPLAAQIGLEILRRGGNAVDAAIATNAALGLMEPMSCGLGGDLFALVWEAKTGKLHGLNASGRAPYAATRELFARRDLTEIPTLGPLSWSVPGCVDGWAVLQQRFAKLPLADLLAPTITYAENGFPVSEVIARYWRGSQRKLQQFPGGAEVFLLGNPPQRAPSTGDVFKNPALAWSLRQIATDGRDAFYKGAIAKRLLEFSQAHGGLFTARDLQEHSSTWVDPVSTHYRGYQVWELPPNGQGIAVLQMLNLLEPYDLKRMGANSPDYWHLFLEAKKLTYADRARYYADPEFAKLPIQELISKPYAKARGQLIKPNQAATQVEPGNPKLGQADTVYLTVVDKDRNCVSLIQSTYHGFGSGLVPPELGFAIQNRGTLFALDADHPNRLEPHKRPFHTIIPAMVTKEGRPWFVFGVMGGDMQPQGQVQVLVNLIDFGMDVQAAGEAPRLEHVGSATPTGDTEAKGGGTVRAERDFPQPTLEALQQKGHQVVRVAVNGGGYQGILIDPTTNMLHGGSEARKDGCAVGY